MFRQLYHNIKETSHDSWHQFNALDKIEALDFSALKILLKTMEPVKLAVENLSREDATLVSAEKYYN